MITAKDIIADAATLRTGYDTIPSFLAKTCPAEMEIARELCDPRTGGYADETERARRVSAIFDFPILEFRYLDGTVCPAFHVRVLQVVLLECPAMAA